MGVLFGHRETLNERLTREAGLVLQPERRRPVRERLTIWAWWSKRRQRKLAKYRGKRGYLSEQEAALGREEFGLRAPRLSDDRTPNCGGG